MSALIPFTEPSPRYRFDPTDRIEIDGVDYVARSVDRFGHTFAKFGAEPVLTISFTHDELRDLLRDGRLQVYARWYDSRRALLRNSVGNTLVRDLPEHEQRLIHWRYEFCDRFLRLEANDRKVRRSDRSMRDAIARIFVEVVKLSFVRGGKGVRCGRTVEQFDPPTPTTLRRWLKVYEQSNFDLISLRPGCYRSGNRIFKLGAESLDFALKWAWTFAASTKPTKVSVYRSYKASALEINAQRLLDGLLQLQVLRQRAFEKLIGRLPVFTVCAGREGEDAARRKFAFQHRGLGVLYPLERVEFDEFLVSLQTLLVEAGVWEGLSPKQKKLVARTRAWLTVAIDCATRCILAMRLLNSEPSGKSSVAALEMAVYDKSEIAKAVGALTPWDMHGRIETVVTDGGTAFVSTEFRSAVRDIGAAYETPPGGLPYLRATIERFFLTVRVGLLNMFPGQTFANVVELGDYKSEANAVLNIEELNRTLIRWAVDVYHNSPHDGLAGETPRQAWLRLCGLYGVYLPEDHARTHIFGIELSRKIGNHGIWVLGLNYQSVELQQHRSQASQKPLTIKVDRRDLGAISVWVNDHWISVPCAFEEMTGCSIAEWTAAAADLRRRNANTAALNEDAVILAMTDIRALSDTATKRAEIGQTVLSADDCEKFERDLFRAFSFADRAESDDEDLLGGGAAASPRQIPAAPRPAPDEFGDPADWLEE